MFIKKNLLTRAIPKFEEREGNIYSNIHWFEERERERAGWFMGVSGLT